MRLNFKWIVPIGLLLGLLEFFWNHHPAPANTPSVTMTAPGVVTAHARENTGQNVATTTAPPPNTWQAKVGTALNSNLPTSEQAKNLLALFPTLPPAGQFEAAHHISNLLPDDSYAAWASYLTSSAVAPETQRVIYTDLLHRPNSVKLPLLLTLARTPAAANATAAAQMLRTTFGEDYGSDWNAWQLRIQTWLNENPDPGSPGLPGMTVGN